MPPLLRSVWDEPGPPNPPPRVWRDWVLVGVLVPVAVLEGLLRPDLPWRAVSVILTVGLVPTLLWRRTRPLPMVAIVFATTSLAPLLTGGDSAETYTMMYLLILVYSLFRWGSGREVALGLTIMLVAVSLSLLLGRITPGDMVGAFAVMFSAMALGGALRYRARARTRELDQIKLLEREQLARDLHDTIAHHVSAMAIRAQAGLATSESRPDAATDALRLIEVEAARALDEMRAMVRILRRDQPADLAPGRRVTDLEQLASRGRSGPSVDVEISGDLDDLPPSVEAAIYRLAQESVTNAQRHARHATRIEVRVTADDTSVRLRVSDDGDSSPIRPAAPPGYGLIGMIERADLLGGTCEAGPDPDRGWTVTAVLPRSGAAT
ncbi:sensor histidine kinase [Streptosporangium minutum]|uniref:histidine kinase n=1 Tax=Streptosporangium minutum TaxID=569862 RepID=A0A243RQ71_9ACTN|nr:histidine kinase [Streptosporangium minutum]OUC97125.1 two-component sensor histidine kinase [Streptosporangium minutum]